MYLNRFDPLKTSGTDGYINYKLSGSDHDSGGGNHNPKKGLGCGGFIFGVLLVFALMNDLAKIGNENLTEFVCAIGFIIIIVLVIKFFHDN